MLSATEVNQVVELLKSAGAGLLETWPGGGPKRDKLTIKRKPDGSYVTSADLKASKLLETELQKIKPGVLVTSEEKETKPEVIKKAEMLWIIDPLDGTRSYVDGRDDFSILVGLCVKNKMKAGFMYFPVQNMIVRAVVGEGTWIDDHKMIVSDADVLRAKRIYMRNFEPLKGHEFRGVPMDSGLALAKVASGELEGAIIKMTHHREWDIAAPAAAIEASGGKITNERGVDLVFGKGETPCTFFVASNGKLHDKLLEIIPSPDVCEYKGPG